MGVLEQRNIIERHKAFQVLMLRLNAGLRGTGHNRACTYVGLDRFRRAS